jgi:hypothetical protein
MNNVESSTNSDSNKVYNIYNNNYDNSNSVVNNCNSINSENININISRSENNSIVYNNVVNRSVGENCVKISNFLKNECVKYTCDVVPII